MRVLWFSNTPSRYYGGGSGKGYNGGGWISSLEACMRDKVDLGLVFLTASAADLPRKVEGVQYYPVHDPSDSRSGRIKKLLLGHGASDKYLVSKYLEVVKEFRPDIIQVFGSEHSFGLVAGHADVPVILHVQGVMKPYYDVYLPMCSWPKYIFCAGGGLSGALQRLYTRSRWRHGVRREKRIFSAVGNYLCRTDWDRAEVLKANPAAGIFLGGEVLRPAFYEARPWAPGTGGRPVYVTTISEPPYKGMDVVLRAGKQLKDSGLDFEWRVFGNVSPAFFEKIAGTSCADAGITLCGVADAATLAAELSACTAYVHPSYIDNSPNSVCEAQLLGVPVVAAEVGGVPSLIENGRTGFLFPAGDAASLAALLTHAVSDSAGLSAATRRQALLRPDRRRITDSLLSVYASCIQRCR